MSSHEALPTSSSREKNPEGEKIVQIFARENEEIISALMENERTSVEQQTLIINDVKNISRREFDRFYADCPGVTFDAPLAVQITTKRTDEGNEFTKLDIAVDVADPRPMDGDYFTVKIAGDSYYEQHRGYECIDGCGNSSTMSEQECRNLLVQFAIDSCNNTDDGSGKSKMTASKVLPLSIIIPMLHEEYRDSPGSSFAATLEEASIDITGRLSYDYDSSSDTLQLETIDNETHEGIRLIFRSMPKYNKPVDETFGVLDPFKQAEAVDEAIKELRSIRVGNDSPTEDTSSQDDNDSFMAIELFHDDTTISSMGTQINPRFIEPSQLTDSQLAQLKEAAEMLGIGHLIFATAKSL